MSTVPPELVALRERAAILCDLDRIDALLFWDQNTMMPPHGATRARRPRRDARRPSRTSGSPIPSSARLLDVLEPWAAGEDPDADDVRLIRELRRDFEKAVRVPTSLAAEMSRAAALGQAAWEEARAAADFGRFRDALARHLELRHRYVDCFTGYEHPYDVLLDDFEPDMTTARAPAAVRRAARGARAARGRRPRGRSCAAVRRRRRVEPQRRALMVMLEGVGFDPDGWRLDVAPHPFAQALGRGDVRVTTRYDMHDFAGAYFGALHEFGHGLYEAQIPERLAAARSAARSRSACTSRRAGCGRTSSGAAAPFCTWVRAAARRDPARLRRRRRGGALPRCQHRPPQPDPGRGGRDDVQPPHHPALRARAGAAGGHARGRRAPARLERGHARAARPRRPRRRAGACSRTSTGAPG